MTIRTFIGGVAAITAIAVLAPILLAWSGILRPEESGNSAGRPMLPINSDAETVEPVKVQIGKYRMVDPPPLPRCADREG